MDIKDDQSEFVYHEGAAFSSTSQRRGSLLSGPNISQNFIPPTNPRNINYYSSTDNNDDAATVTSTADYSMSIVEQYIQSRRASLASRKDIVSLNPTEYSHLDSQLGAIETSFATEFFTLLKYSVPLVITFLLQFSLTVASVFSVGRLGKSELAAVSLASMTANISAYGIIQGISTCLDTLCPQAYGRGDYRSVGLQFFRCTILLLIIYIPIYIFWVFFSEQLLTSIIQDQPVVCELASKYLSVLVYGIPGFILFENLKHYLQAQGIFHASTYVLVFCAPLNILLNFQLVWNETFGLGFIGAPTAVVITNWCMGILLLLYTVFVRGYECWCGFTSDVLIIKNYNRMIKLAFPGLLMVEAEWLAFEIITFGASRFGTLVLAAQSVISTTCVLMYQIPFAISIAASTRVAWFIGSASKDASILTTKVSLIMSLLIGVINGVLLATYRETIASLFSNDPEVIKLAGQVLILGAIYQVNDSVGCITGGILRGQGRQYIGGWLNLLSYYCLALPVAFLCAFHFNMNLFGLWIGMVIALFFISTIQTVVILTSDWDEIIKQSIQDAINEQSTGNGNILSHQPSIDHNFLSPSISCVSIE